MAFLGIRLKEFREKAGYTQEDLANYLDTSQTQVWRWEVGKNEPTSDTIVKIAKILNVTADYLLGLADDPHGQLMETDLSDEEWRLVNAYRADDMGRVLAILSAAALKRKS